ncbi:MAG: branched-chain amino acid transport system substrate-binding protein [Solirubrobacteraceae bacterium]|jgi:branched-chain amino acid transport system substrate-binding protein|nr:branched-chain amino acid transport system substrate-binding protein [Solirubrobacteraceae bacterium]
MSKQRFGHVSGRVSAALALCVLAVGVAACGGSDSGDSASGGGDSAKSGGSMTLAFSGTLSGPFATYAQQMRQGVDLAVGEINTAGGISGKQLKVNYADDRGKPENGIVIAQRFCNDDASVVLGYSVSTVALAALPTFERCQLPVVASATTSPKFTGLSDFYFRTVLSDAVAAAEGARYAVEQLGHKRIAVMYQKDDYGEGGDKSFVDAAKAAGAEIVYDQGYQLGTRNFLSQLTKIKSTNADMIFLSSFYPEAARIAQQAEQLNMKVPFLGLDGVLSPDLPKLAGTSAEGMLVLGYFNPNASGGGAKVSEFVDAFKQKYGQPPSDWSALAYDAVYAVQNAAKSGSGTDRAAIAKGLPSASFDGATGPVAFDKGDRKGNAVIFEVKGKDFVPAEEQPAAGAS